jgi:uncharacterized protein
MGTSFLGMNSAYIAMVVVSLLLGICTQAFISRSYSKYSHRDNRTGMTGAQIARRMLDDNGMSDVPVECVAGTLSDHFDPRGPVVRLSEGVYGSASVSAMAVACHECGHAVQHARGYAPMRVRTALVPVANFGSTLWIWLLLIGLFLNATGLIWVGIALFSFSVLFHLVTLPVEFNASRRGMDYIRGDAAAGQVEISRGVGAVLPDSVAGGARRVLTAAALTYVASALTSLMQLFYYIGIARNRS